MNTDMREPNEGEPAFLSFGYVQTIIHEIGHCLHVILYKGSIKSLSALEAPFDFLEIPSQFLENFIWERQALDMFAEHYETKEKIPDELFNNMIASKNYLMADYFMYHLYLSRIDLAYHQEYEKYKNMEPNDVDNAVSKIISSNMMNLIYRNSTHTDTYSRNQYIMQLDATHIYGHWFLK